MRSDNIKRHESTHKDILTMPEDEQREELRARNDARLRREEQTKKLLVIAQQEQIPIDPIDVTQLREDLLHDNSKYLHQIELGKQISKIINEGVVREESLTTERRKALTLYRQTKATIDIAGVQLRSWQQSLMEKMKIQSDRAVFWIVGNKGNEGKSWFQGYLETFYGYAHVVRLDLCSSSSDILHALSKRPLSTTNIFLFNDTRSSSRYQCQNYSILENIKDGCAISTKYKSETIRFRVPNMVIVFANSTPDSTRLSQDRWRVYTINKEGLKFKETQI